MFKYILITYNGEEIDKSECFIFKSYYGDCDLDPHGDHVPFPVGSNQAIFELENSPIELDNIEFINE